MCSLHCDQDAIPPDHIPMCSRLHCDLSHNYPGVNAICPCSWDTLIMDQIHPQAANITPSPLKGILSLELCLVFERVDISHLCSKMCRNLLYLLSLI